MNIWIDSRSLASGEEAWLLPGAIYGLQRLNEMNYPLAADTGSLTDHQRAILEHEGIVFGEFSRDEADLVLSSNQEALVLKRVASGSDSTPAATGSDWNTLIHAFLFPQRKVARERKTGETDISIRLNLDGTGQSEIDTGLKFFNHMLDQIARHGLVDLAIRCRGDLEIDEHHTIEDVAITLGEAIWEVCGKDKTGIQRYGFLLPMDESQAEVALDLSNRPYLVWDVEFHREYAGDFPLDMAEHFFHTLAMNLRATLQIRASGRNDHHKLEAIFKGFARALRFAVTRTERSRGILPSSKGKL